MPAPKKDVYSFIGKSAAKVGKAAKKKAVIKDVKKSFKEETKRIGREYDLEFGNGLNKSFNKFLKAEKKINKKESKANKRGLKADNEPTRASKIAKKGS